MRDTVATVERNDLLTSPSAALQQTRRYGRLRLRLATESGALAAILPGQFAMLRPAIASYRCFGQADSVSVEFIYFEFERAIRS